ncbi:hypothetical protein HK096_006624 [Nowakowskiella sp. JEL0078]|nr:hypothetical protein HK096_006624 [Nowakowskiella sp. JEL0078]
MDASNIRQRQSTGRSVRSRSRSPVATKNSIEINDQEDSDFEDGPNELDFVDVKHSVVIECSKCKLYLPSFRFGPADRKRANGKKTGLPVCKDCNIQANSSFEKTCAECGKTKDVKKFSNAQRSRKDNAICLKCVERKTDHEYWTRVKDENVKDEMVKEEVVKAEIIDDKNQENTSEDDYYDDDSDNF